MSPRPSIAPLTALITLTTGTLLVAAPSRAQSAPPEAYTELENAQGHYINLSYPPVRPMAYDAANLQLYAINNHGNTVLQFTGVPNTLTNTYRVPWTPVAVALWDPDPQTADDTQVLVVTRGTPGLCILDATTADYLAFVPAQASGGAPLAEPSDLLVVGDKAYVSCMGSQRVLEIDLVTQAGAREFTIPSSHPLYLSQESPTSILVAPLYSGNATAAHKGQRARTGIRGVIDLSADSPIVTPGESLPDNDLFRIDLAGGCVEPVATELGTVLFEQGIRPGTSNEVWVLNTDARNEELTGVEELRGQFVHNRITRALLSNTGDCPGGVPPTVVEKLDTFDLDNPASGRPLGQPVALTFGQGPPNDIFANRAFVAGMLTDNVAVFDDQGFLLSWDVGSIPRGLVITYNLVWVYCWGSNTIEAYRFPGGVPTLWKTLDLGHDPAPPRVQTGRELFYDGSNSGPGNLSCASCHVDGRTDMTVWNLGDATNNKGPMLTQTLAGIESLTPYHWRGENTLLDFNAAFDDLLGGAPLSPTDFADLETFLFSIHNPPNPHQARDRLIDPNLKPEIGDVPGLDPLYQTDAVQGRADFDDHCLPCHDHARGTNHDFTGDGDFMPIRNLLKNAPFHELWRRDVDSDFTVPGITPNLVLLNGSDPALPPFQIHPVTGGLSHAGVISTREAFTFSLFPFPVEEEADIFAFLHQFDQGLAPATQAAFVYDSDTPQSVIDDDIVGFLLDQATNPIPTQSGPLVRSCDVGVLGSAKLAGTQRTMAWFYDVGTQKFIPEDPGLPKVSFTFFGNKVAKGGRFVFFGVPYGMGRRFFIDADNDGLRNLEEANHNTDPFMEDTDGDTLWDGYEVLHGTSPLVPEPQQIGQPLSIETTDPVFVSAPEVLWRSARVARVQFETDEPTTALVQFASQLTSHSGQIAVDLPATVHSVVLSDLAPSNAGLMDSVYDIDVTVTDLSSNTAMASATVTMDPFGDSTGVVLDVFEFDCFPVPCQVAPAVLNLHARVVERRHTGSPLPIANYWVACKVYVDGQPANTITTSTPQFFTFGDPMVGPPTPYDASVGGTDGPFVLSGPTDAFGDVYFDVTIPGTTGTEKIEVQVEAISTPDVTSPIPNFPALQLFSLPETPKEFRVLTINGD